MNNKQLAAARAAFNRFPNIRAEKVGDTLIPVVIGSGARGASVVVTDTMSAREIERAVALSCGALG